MLKAAILTLLVLVAAPAFAQGTGPVSTSTILGWGMASAPSSEVAAGYTYKLIDNGGTPIAFGIAACGNATIDCTARLTDAMVQKLNVAGTHNLTLTAASGTSTSAPSSPAYVLTTPPPPAVTPSPEGASNPTTSPLVDATGAAWTFGVAGPNSSHAILVNGAQASGAFGRKILKCGGIAIIGDDPTDVWYRYAAGTFTPSAVPTCVQPVPPVPPPPVPTGCSNGTTIVVKGTLWSYTVKQNAKQAYLNYVLGLGGWTLVQSKKSGSNWFLQFRCDR